MELGISIFVGIFLVIMGAISYYRIDKDFKEGTKKKWTNKKYMNF